MSERDALLAAIRGAPDDDTPRLVWADWHEDRGRPLYAEFVRAQVELARLPQVRALRLRYRPDASDGPTVTFRTKAAVDEVGEEVDLHYDSGQTRTIVVTLVSERVDRRSRVVGGLVLQDNLKANRDRVRRRELRARTWDLWRTGEVTAEAVPSQLAVADVGLEYRPPLRAVVSRGLVSTLAVSVMDDDEWVRDVCRSHPVRRIVLVGSWDLVEDRVEAGYLPDDVPLDFRLWARDGRETFVSEMEDGQLLALLTACERPPGYLASLSPRRGGTIYLLRKEAERRGLLSRTGVPRE